MMQLPRHVRTGDLVEVRRQRWRVIDVRAYERCQLLTLTGIGAANAGLARRFLAPFERIDGLDRPAPIQFVRPQRWRRACRALIADRAPAAGLRAARSARMDLLPHQLEPALAIVRGQGARLLLADEVGLGKTIQAGLIIAELRARGMAERVLIVTPAGLRDQWVAELLTRFGVSAAIVDFRDVRQRVANLPVGLNPWSTVSTAIVSMDYVKRPDVLKSVISCRWDVLIVDEAHGAARDSDRRAACTALARQTEYVLLLTATPHNGDRRAFNALCQIGAHHDPILVFRRTRADVRVGHPRRVHCLLVRPSAAEARMHALLLEFTRAVRAERTSDDIWLPLAVLHKRSLSSARSLEQSIDRRLAMLAPPSAAVHQLDLPLADPTGELDPTDETPAWAATIALADEERERRMLRAIADAARTAGTRETKLSAVVRLLNRIAEPIVIFTEYRDTLFHLRDVLSRPVALLHGGMARDERSQSLDDFVNGRRHILLATDAAGEGLNLHHRCRIVINLELPWNPMRLEQRIGRVDRIGQLRPVHVFHLIAGETSESRVLLPRLKGRIALAREDIPSANPIEDDERTIAKRIIDARGEQGSVDRSASGQTDAFDAGRVTLSLRQEACAEAARLTFARRLSTPEDELALASLDAAGTWVTTARSRKTRACLGSRILAISRVDYEDGQGRTSHWTIVPLEIRLADLQRRLTRREIRSLLLSIGADLETRALDAAAEEASEAQSCAAALAETTGRRERAIAEAILRPRLLRLQPGLFDRRAEQTHLLDRSALTDAADESARRIRACERAAAIVRRPPRLVLVLLP